MAHCELHPDLDAIGICMSCKRQICGQCATRVDGINRCTSCLAQMATLTQPAEGGSKAVGARWPAYAALAGYLFLLFAITWALLSAALRSAR